MNRPSWPGLLRETFSERALDEDVMKDARRLHRRGMIQSISTTAGCLAGFVREGDDVRRALWQVPEMSDADWAYIEGRAHSMPTIMGRLLDMQRPDPSVELNDLVAPIVPPSADLEPTCDCDDWLSPCSHALAVALAFVESTRDNLWPLFELRGRNHDWLVMSEASARATQLLARYGSPSAVLLPLDR